MSMMAATPFLYRLCSNSKSTSRRIIAPLQRKFPSNYYHSSSSSSSTIQYIHTRSNTKTKNPKIKGTFSNNSTRSISNKTNQESKDTKENINTEARTFEIKLDSENEHADDDALTKFSVDRSSMFEADIHLPDKPNFSDKKMGYEEQTPLSSEMISWIGIDGPIGTSEFMNQALTHPKHGYYTSQHDDDGLNDNEHDEESSLPSPIGKRGDFTTAPEISQVFGESIFIYFLSLWRNNALLASKQAPDTNADDKIEMIEIGPGKGTLMYDILSTAIRNSNSFDDFTKYIHHVHLVEVSHDLRKIQREKLHTLNAISPLFDIVFLEDGDTAKDNLSDEKKTIYVSWYSNLKEVPSKEEVDESTSLYIICQELFDTLPIHSFEKLNEACEWRERLVDVDVTDNPVYETITAIQKRPRLRFVLSKHATEKVHSLLTPLNHLEDDTSIPIGSIVEISTDGNTLIQDIQSRIGNSKEGSSALILDYGYYDDEIQTQSTLRAFRRHESVHPLTTPGLVDLTADVNFTSLQRSLSKSQDVQVLGPVTQQHFLTKLGIVDRVEAIIDDEKTTDEQAEEIVDALERLISDEKNMMGATYKVMSLVKSVRDTSDIHGF